jgi:hypothetical protein
MKSDIHGKVDKKRERDRDREIEGGEKEKHKLKNVYRKISSFIG